MGLLINLVIWVIVLAILWYVLSWAMAQLEVPAPIQKIITVVVVLIALVALLGLLGHGAGLFESGQTAPVSRPI